MIIFFSLDPSQFGPCSVEAHRLFLVFFHFFQPAIIVAHLGPPRHGGPSSLLAHFCFGPSLAHLRRRLLPSDARATATRPVGIAPPCTTAPSFVRGEPNRRAARPPSFCPMNRRCTVSPSSSKRPTSKRTPRPPLSSSDWLPPLLSSPIKGTSTSPFYTTLCCPAPPLFSVLLASCPRKEAIVTLVRSRQLYLVVDPAEETLGELRRVTLSLPKLLQQTPAPQSASALNAGKLLLPSHGRSTVDPLTADP
jgi:hypothetical protein